MSYKTSCALPTLLVADTWVIRFPAAQTGIFVLKAFIEGGGGGNFYGILSILLIGGLKFKLVFMLSLILEGAWMAWTHREIGKQ